MRRARRNSDQGRRHLHGPDSSEQGVPDVAALDAAWWDCEHRRADGRGLDVEQIDLVEPALDGDELAVDVGLV